MTMNDFHPTSSRRVTDRPFADNRRLLHQLVPIAPVVVLLMVRGGILAKDSEPKADIDQKIQAVLQADDNYRAHLAYRALFKASGAAGLSALKLHGNDGIAIQAAWEEVKLTVPEKKPEQAVPLMGRCEACGR